MHTAGHHGEWTAALPGQHPAPQEQVSRAGVPKAGSPQTTRGSPPHLCPTRFGDGYMITVRTKSSQNVKDVVRFFNRNFPEAVLKVGVVKRGKGRVCPTQAALTATAPSPPPGTAPHKGAVSAQVGAHLAGSGVQQDGAGGGCSGHRGLLSQPDHPG